MKAPIGIFDSGYGGLTVFRSIKDLMPQYDYVYLGDNARAPYGNRSFETVYEYTRECVHRFFRQGCPLVILACNTASAKALRSIQQKDLQQTEGNKRVLGVIRPTAEVIGDFTQSRKVGILGTKGTVNSLSYIMEIQKFFPDVEVFQTACPQLVPLIENKDYDTDAADYFVKKYIDTLFGQDADIDTVLLACTHYPILMDKFRKYAPQHAAILSQGDLVAKSLKDYLHRHPEIETQISQTGSMEFYTTDDVADFDEQATVFFGEQVESKHLHL